MLLKPRRRPIRKTMAALAATPGIVWASVAPAHDDAKPTVDSPQAPLCLPPKRPYANSRGNRARLLHDQVAVTRRDLFSLQLALLSFVVREGD